MEHEGKAARDGTGASGLHVAIIMDGSGRWAVARALPRFEGHRSGVGAVRRVVAAAPALGIGTLTLFAFSSGNWGRPDEEVEELFRIFAAYLISERTRWILRDTRVNVIGRRDRIPRALREAAEVAETVTADGSGLALRIAIDYSAREAVVQAARRAKEAPSLSEEEFSAMLADAMHEPWPIREVDLLIRTGGEKRLSDCLLWEGTYAEMVFTHRLWPDFTGVDLRAAVKEFHSRDRRFGRVPGKRQVAPGRVGT